MQPIGLLMIEHRLIERLIAEIDRAVSGARARGRIDPLVVESAIDFVKTYADRTHHGKEEDILFRELGKKRLSPEDLRVMQELVEEHKVGRETVRRLVEATATYREGAPGALTSVLAELSFLTQFYPQHIDKEDKLFFPKSMKYLGESERSAMLAEMHDFDRKMIHEKYAAVVEAVVRRVRGAVT